MSKTIIALYLAASGLTRSVGVTLNDDGSVTLAPDAAYAGTADALPNASASQVGLNCTVDAPTVDLSALFGQNPTSCLVNVVNGAGYELTAPAGTGGVVPQSGKVCRLLALDVSGNPVGPWPTVSGGGGTVGGSGGGGGVAENAFNALEEWASDLPLDALVAARAVVASVDPATLDANMLADYNQAKQLLDTAEAAKGISRLPALLAAFQSDQAPPA